MELKKTSVLTGLVLTWAPCLTKMAATLTLSSWPHKCSGVRPFLAQAPAAALCSIRSVAMSVWPSCKTTNLIKIFGEKSNIIKAYIKGFLIFYSIMQLQHFYSVTGIIHHLLSLSFCITWELRWSGVKPALDSALALAPYSSSVVAISIWFLREAIWRGV